MKKVVLEWTPNYWTLNTSNIDTPNFERFEHEPQILRPNFEQERPNIEHLQGKARLEFLAYFRPF